MLPENIITEILGIVLKIYEIVQLVKANKEQSIRLYQRIKIVTDATSGLDKLPDTMQFLKGLNAMQELANESLDFIMQFSQENWFKKVLFSGQNKEKFEELNQNLYEISNLLNLGIVAQQLINREEDNSDQKKDLNEIKDNQSTILRLQEKSHEKLDNILINQEELQKIIIQQLASVKLHLNGITTPSSEKHHPIDVHFIVPYYDMTFYDVIGQGSFGTIYRAEWSGQQVAVKTITSLDENAKNEFIREIQIMSRMRSLYVTQFYGACLEPGRECILMEHMDKGSLYDLLHVRSEKLRSMNKYSLMLDIAQGIKYLHNNDILHRDLKSKNILINADLRGKIADFGLARTRAASVNSIHKASEALEWMAPEILSRKGKYSKKSDIYSLGVIFWEILTGKTPFSDMNTVEDLIRGKREAIPPKLPLGLQSIIRHCWSEDPSVRPSADELVDKLKVAIEGIKLYTKAQSFELKTNDEQAALYYRQAAETGNARGQCNYGLFFLSGRGGMARDPSAAYKWILKSATQGFDRAEFNIAIMLEKGEGVEKNRQSAHRFFKLAKAHGNKDAAKKCDALQLK